MCFRKCDDVLYVGLLRIGKTLPSVRTVYAAEFFDNYILDGLRVGIVAAVIRRTSIFGTDLDPSPVARCISNGIVITAFDGIVVTAGDEQGMGEQNSVFEGSHLRSLWGRWSQRLPAWDCNLKETE